MQQWALRGRGRVRLRAPGRARRRRAVREGGPWTEGVANRCEARAPGRFFCPWTQVPLLQARGARGEIPRRAAKRARGRLFSRPGSQPLPNLSNRTHPAE